MGYQRYLEKSLLPHPSTEEIEPGVASAIFGSERSIILQEGYIKFTIKSFKKNQITEKFTLSTIHKATLTNKGLKAVILTRFSIHIPTSKLK